jgi:carboxypeptidase C (cathepsin A)
MYEMGPFSFAQQQAARQEGMPPTLVDNPYRWNRIAHMLYLEAPAFVGFSYSNTPSDINTNDNRTADDNLQALLLFFQNYPELAQNEFYIMGESYAGVYVPTLANAIRVSNAAGINPTINLVCSVSHV